MKKNSKEQQFSTIFSFNSWNHRLDSFKRKKKDPKNCNQRWRSKN